MSKSAAHAMFSTNKDIEKKGLILDYGDFKVRIARAGGANTKFEKVLDLVSKPYKRAIANDSIDPKLAKKIMIEVYAKSVVIGWENMTDSEGVVLDFNYENCVKILTELPDLFADIQAQANSMTLFKTQILEEEEKN